MTTHPTMGRGVRPETLDLDPPQQRRIAAAIDALVARLGSNGAVAKATGLGSGMVSRLRLARRHEHHVQVPSIDKVAAACGITREELLSGTRTDSKEGRAA